MVAKIISGKSISGAIRYNEHKVQEGKAMQLMAQYFPSEQLSFRQKVGRFEALTSQNRRCKTNAVHISLNFDPSEKPDDFSLRQIAMAYMEKIGFGAQPFLLFRHYDAAHPHVHIVTTNIKDGGERIPLHNIGKNQSEAARKEIELEFDLVPAEGRVRQQEMYLKPADPEKAIYGKSETKAAISNVVCEVVSSYKYGSLAELNAILRLYNVTADRGLEGTRMYDKGGLVYSILDDRKNKIGVPIKASTLYGQPTLPRLEKQFTVGKEGKKEFRDSLRKIIDAAIKTEGVTDKDTFVRQMELENVSVVFRQNDHGRIYGVTFVDHLTKVVFNGSDLAKDYSAGRLLDRIETEQKTERTNKFWNEQYIRSVLNELDFSKGFASVVAQMYQKGIRISVGQTDGDNTAYMLGHYRSPVSNYWRADKKWTAYFSVNRMDQQLASNLSGQKKLYQRPTNADTKAGSRSLSSHGSAPTPVNTFLLEKFIQNFLNAPGSSEAPSIQSPQKRKKKRRI